MGLLLVLLGGVVAYFLAWKGLTVAQMRADLAAVLNLPGAGALQAAAAAGVQAFPNGPADRAGGLTAAEQPAGSSLVGRLGANAPGFAP